MLRFSSPGDKTSVYQQWYHLGWRIEAPLRALSLGSSKSRNFQREPVVRREQPHSRKGYRTVLGIGESRKRFATEN